MNYYIYNAFLRNDIEISQDLSNFVSTPNLNDLINYKAVILEKAININATKKVTILSKYKSSPLDIIADFQDGLWTGEKGEMVSAKVLRNTNFKASNGRLDFTDIAEIDVEVSKLETRTLTCGDILLEKSGGSPTQPVGRVRLFDVQEDVQYSYSNFCSRIRVFNKDYDSSYIWVMLNEFYMLGGTVPLQNGVRLLNLKIPEYKKVRIPKPPLEIQQKIATEVLKIYSEEKANASELARDVINNYLL